MTSHIPLPHEKLFAYRSAIDLLQLVDQMRIVDPRLRDQISRAAKSVCLNIAEAVGRTSGGDRKRVYSIARGECCEAAAAIDVARAIGECDPQLAAAAREVAGRVYALLTGLIRRYDFETAGTKPAPVEVPNCDLDVDIQAEHDRRHDTEHQNEDVLDHSGQHQHVHVLVPQPKPEHA